MLSWTLTLSLAVHPAKGRFAPAKSEEAVVGIHPYEMYGR